LTGKIKLLTDAVANQIAAGEVVQRPASIVKELLENSLDAGATHIKLLIKDGGSTLVQVIDNGKGMSETDARLCWERHATSKIQKAEDLFSLNTYGFRGEALASIAAVAQVEMKTRRKDEDVAILIKMEASECIEQSVVAAPVGTSIAVKNLFYNVPARRNFLKSITVETKHIYEEFQRQALANPNVSFELYNQEQEVFKFTIRPLKDRVADVLGKKKTEDLISIQEETEIIQINGFVGDPKIARRTRGDQYLFVNDRFIKSPYFNHAINQTFEGLIDKEAFPTYVLYFYVDASKVDVNVHPTKTEVKFEDERHMYNIIKAAVKKGINQHLVPGSDDFLLDSNLASQKPPMTENINWNDFQTNANNQSSYNPFNAKNHSSSNAYKQQDWEKILGPTSSNTPTSFQQERINNELPLSHQTDDLTVGNGFCFGQGYYACTIEGKLNLFDIRRMIRHIHFHKYLSQLEKQKGVSQQLLFPKTVELGPSTSAVLSELIDEFKFLGFDLGHFGGNSVIVNGVPPQISSGDEQAIIEKIIEDYENTSGEMKLKKNVSLARSLSNHSTRNIEIPNKTEELQHLIAELHKLESPQFDHNGKQIFITLGPDSIFEFFNPKSRT